MPSRLEDFRFARWVKSLNRTTQIILGLTLVAGLNFVAATHYHRWDLTANHRFSLSPETKSILQHIPHDLGNPPVTISLILPDNPDNENNRIVLQEIRALLKEYVYKAGHPGPEEAVVPLKVEEVDKLKQETRYRELYNMGANEATMAMVSLGQRGHAITMADFFDTKQTDLSGSSMGSAATGFNGESAVSAGILDVVQTKAEHIYLTSGHAEMNVTDTIGSQSLSAMYKDLRLHNYNVQPLDLTTTEKVPKDAKLVIIVAPALPFTPDEVDKLLLYLNEQNGRILVFLQPGEKSGLDPLFFKWGLISKDWLVVETDRNHQVGHNLAIAPWEDATHHHELTRWLGYAQVSVILGRTRPVEIAANAPSDDRRKISQLLFTTKMSFAVNTDDLEDTNPVRFPGPFSVAALSERKASDAVSLPGGKLLVFGDADLIANTNYNTGGNQVLFLNCVKYLASDEYKLSIPPKPPTQAQLSLTDAEYTGLAWRLAILPALVMALGIGVFWVRQRA